MIRKLYVAYGSNLHKGQMNYRCKDAVEVETGVIKDYELLFKGSKTGAYATIERKEGSIVPVLVWSISEDDEKSLDRYEGYPKFYYKKDIEVLMDSGEVIEGIVYIMDETRKIGIPSKEYYNVIKESYKRLGFDDGFICKNYS